MERVTYASSAASALLEACGRLGVSRLGFEAHDVSVAAHGRLDEALEDVELVAVQDAVERGRWVKDEEELAALRDAQRVTDLAFDDILEWLAIGQTERQVAHQLELVMRREGADGISFEPIVAFGENAAEPHHEPGHRVLEEGDIVKLDIGALWAGYHADMTRTIAFGEPAAELKKVHEVVQEAQQAGIDTIREGVTGAEVDAASRKVIEDAGYGERFSHGLGTRRRPRDPRGSAPGPRVRPRAARRSGRDGRARHLHPRPGRCPDRGHGRGHRRRVPRARHLHPRPDRAVRS